MTEQEEFEFRLRLEQETAGAPMSREQLISQIPTGGVQAPQAGNRVQPRTIVQSMLEGAMAVPVLAGAARGAQLLSRGTQAAPYLGQLASAVIPQSGKALMAEGLIGAAAGGAGEIAARQVPSSYSSLAEIGAGTVAGAGAAGLMGSLTRLGGLKAGVENLFSPVKDLADQIARVSGSGRASAQAITALQANPSLAGSIGRALEIEKTTGIALPMLAASNGDTTISSYMQSQIAKGDNSLFTAQVKQQYLAAEKALAEAKKGVAPSMQEVDAYVKKKAVEAGTANLQTVAEAAKTSARRTQGLENIDNRILELSSDLQQAPGRADIGDRLTNLISAKQKAAFNEVSPKYTKLIDESEAAGIRLPGEAAKELKAFVTERTNDDVFNKFPQLYSAIKSVFRGETKPVSTKLAEKYTFVKEPETFKDYSLKDLDSLKRATNKALRETQRGSDQYRIVQELKQQVDNAIDSVDPVFSAPYRAIDQEYATKVGLPFKTQGVINIDRAKFVDDAVPAMTKNTSSLKDTLNIVGDSPEGLQIVKDAFLFDIGNNKSIVNTATGELNPRQLQRYLSTNKEKIDLVPGLRGELENLGSRVGVLRDNRTAILEAEKAAKIDKIENLWTQSYGASGGIRGVVQSALKNQQQLDTLLQVAGKDKVAKEGIKSALLDDLVNAPGDRMALFTENKDAISKVFGTTETNQLKDIVEASQRLKDNPFKMNININTISKSRLESEFGSKPETSLGELRNQILSGPRVLINHLGRFWSNQANKNEAAEVQKFLLDKKALNDAALLINEIDTRGFTDRALSLVGRLSKNSASNWLLGATVGGGIAAQERERETYTPSASSLMEGFEAPVPRISVPMGFTEQEMRAR